MCGFVGILRQDGEPVEEGRIVRMLEPLRHRGPDGRGTWCGEGIGLGHVRLSILDLSERARQPIMGTGSGGVLVYNGEVYNYRELRRELEREGGTFVSTGDTEVVLKALEIWGVEQAVPRFDGMFALAYYETAKRALWLVRDRLGIKPLYMARCGDEILFGSEPKAILAHPGMETRPDRLAVASFVLRGRPDPRISFYEGITALEPGSWRRIDVGGSTGKRWFHVLDALQPERIVSRPKDGVVDLCEGAITASVRMHLASDVPLATICSGGVDSSLITALAARGYPRLRSYVADVSFDQGEGNAAQRVADRLGIPLVRVPIGRERFLRAWPEAVFHGGPCFHRSDVALLSLVRVCHGDGIKVLLNGEGADELFGGYLWQEAAFRTYHWPSRLARAIIPVPSWRRRARRNLQNAWFNPLPGLGRSRRGGMTVFDGEGEVRRRAILEKLQLVRSRADRVFLARCLDDLYYSLDTLLRRHDRMSMASSVEMRVPFVENSLIDLGIHLPRLVKYRRGQPKWLLKQVARKYLPDDIVFARKRAFPLPASFDAGCEALLRRGGAGDLLHWTRATTDALVDEARRDGRLRFLLLGVELWVRIALRGEKPDDLRDELMAAAGA